MSYGVKVKDCKRYKKWEKIKIGCKLDISVIKYTLA